MLYQRLWKHLGLPAAGTESPGAAPVELEVLLSFLSDLQAWGGGKGHTLGQAGGPRICFSLDSTHGEGPAPILQRRKTEFQG